MPVDNIIKNLEQYIATLNPSPFGADTDLHKIKLTQIKAGLHNANFLLEVEGAPTIKKYVVRFHPSNKEGGDKTAIEAKNMKLLANLPVPQLIHVGKPAFLDSTVIITDFIEGEHKNLNKLTENETKELARVVAQMHHIKNAKYSSDWGTLPTESGDYQDYLRSIVDATITQVLVDIDPAIYQDSTRLISDALSQLKRSFSNKDFDILTNGFSLLHTDLGRSNIIWHNGLPTIIDWEEVSFGDPADEVAYIFTIDNLNDEVRKAFLDEYLQYYSDETFLDRLPTYILKNRLFDLVWSIGKLDSHVSGKESELTVQTTNTYKQFYTMRRMALKALLKNTDRLSL